MVDNDESECTDYGGGGEGGREDSGVRVDHFEDLIRFMLALSAI
jgi:hypothetical protein